MDILKLMEVKKGMVRKHLAADGIKFNENESKTKISFPISLSEMSYTADIHFVKDRITPFVLNSTGTSTDPLSMLEALKEYFIANDFELTSDNTNHTYEKYRVSFSKAAIGATVYAERSGLVRWVYRIILTNNDIEYDKRFSSLFEKTLTKMRISRIANEQEAVYMFHEKHGTGVGREGVCTVSDGHSSKRYGAHFGIAINSDINIIEYPVKKKLKSVAIPYSQIDELLPDNTIIGTVDGVTYIFEFDKLEDYAKKWLEAGLGYGEDYYELRAKVEKAVLDYDPRSQHRLKNDSFENKIDAIARRVYKTPDMTKAGLKHAVSNAFSDNSFSAELSELIWAEIHK